MIETSIQLGEPVEHRGIVIAPLFPRRTPEAAYVTLEEALPLGFRVDEVSESGSVPELAIRNPTDRDVLLYDGEELIGAKQNRILNTTVLVAAHSHLTIPVSCVEQGRWAYKSPRFAAGDASLYASVRALKAEKVTASLRARGKHTSDQFEIWEGVSYMAATLDVASPTGAMGDFYARYVDQVAAARTALAPRPGQVGALVFLGNRWLGLEILPSPGLFERAWPRLSAGYAAESIGETASAPLPDPRALLDGLAQAPVEEAPAVGLGREHRLAGKGVAGAALVGEETVAHLMAFPVAG